MKLKNNMAILFSLLSALTLLNSCQAIGDIFKTGVWVGIIIVILVVIIIFWIIGKAKK